MTTLKDRVFRLLQDPRVARLAQRPAAQRLVMRGLRLRGRAEGAFDDRVQRIASALNLATQRDLRALQRRIRHLEQELREAQERLTETEGIPEAQVRN